MSKISRLLLAVAASSILTVAAWAVPGPVPNNGPNQAGLPSAAQLQSASGKIAFVDTNSFTLETASDLPRGNQFAQSATVATMTFLVDKNTSISGRLTVGANADVSYRTQDGNNIAVAVSVIP